MLRHQFSQGRQEIGGTEDFIDIKIFRTLIGTLKDRVEIFTSGINVFPTDIQSDMLKIHHNLLIGVYFKS